MNKTTPVLFDYQTSAGGTRSPSKIGSEIISPANSDSI
jgi:hypothetical protein